MIPPAIDSYSKSEQGPGSLPSLKACTIERTRHLIQNLPTVHLSFSSKGHYLFVSFV